MQANYVQRIRIVFRKFGSTRFIGHLDLARAWERTLNRAQIPVAYTQGFNRRPRMQFATATPLGVTSDAEIMDILLRETMDITVLQTMLVEKMPPGIEIVSMKDVPIKEKNLQANTTETTFVVNLGQDISVAELQAEVDTILNAETVIRTRRKKEYDLRPRILDLQVSESEAEETLLTLRLVLEPSKTGRADEVLAELGLDPLDYHINRTDLQLNATPETA